MKFTHSGLRGIFGKDLSLNDVINYSLSFGQWLGSNSTVLIGRDTRESSSVIFKTISQSLLDVGVNVIDGGVVPTPLIIHEISNHSYDGAIIITGSHNPPEYNGIKFLNSSGIFLGVNEISQLNSLLDEPRSPDQDPIIKGRLHSKDIVERYVKKVSQFVTIPRSKQNTVSILIDPNAGTAFPALGLILENLGCTYKIINEKFEQDFQYPREIEPTPEHLTMLSQMIKKDHYDFGIAFDCDADRIAIADEKGTVYSEDTAIVLLTSLILENQSPNNKRDSYIVTNIASSRAFDDIAKKYDAKLIRTPIGERNLSLKHQELQQKYPQALIIGGEGSSGGFMYPDFNNARDGLFATAKLCELLVKAGKKISQLVDELPKYYSHREKLYIDKNLSIKMIKGKITEQNIPHSVIGNDLIVKTNDPSERILIHPSNTEPIIRIIVESKNKEKSIELSKWILSLIHN